MMSEDGDGGLLSVASQRKRAEEDVKLLANRINHLKAEEEKARRKILEVHEQTKQLTVTRERRSADQARKAAAEERARLAEEERRGTLRQRDFRREVSVRKKQETRCGVLSSAVRLERINRAEELRRAAELEEGKQRVLRDRANAVRRTEANAQHARARVEIERREYARNVYDDRRVLESRRIQKASDVLEQMENEEMEVLQRLQHSQALYESACKEYEVVRGSGPAGRPLGPPLTLPALARGSTPPPLRTPRGALALPDEKVPSERGRPGSSVSTAPSERSSKAPREPAALPLEPPLEPPTPPTTITYTTLDGITVTIPAVDPGFSALDLAESLNR